MRRGWGGEGGALENGRAVLDQEEEMEYDDDEGEEE